MKPGGILLIYQERERSHEYQIMEYECLSSLKRIIGGDFENISQEARHDILTYVPPMLFPWAERVRDNFIALKRKA